MQEFSKADLLGHLSPEADSRFTRIQDATGSNAYFLRREAAEAWLSMVNSALPDGIELFPVSATRNFEKQKNIWENKWIGKTPVNKLDEAYFASLPDAEKAKEIMKYSAMPGTSRHHWGTDIDINSVEPEYFDSDEGKKVYIWLQVNASKFGFSQPYTVKNEERLLGYEEEKWHWSYLPLARPMLNAYLKQIHYTDISGFLGDHTAETLKVIPRFVMGIAPHCR